jgi:hypothetical protein
MIPPACMILDRISSIMSLSTAIDAAKILLGAVTLVYGLVPDPQLSANELNWLRFHALLSFFRVANITFNFCSSSGQTAVFAIYPFATSWTFGLYVAQTFTHKMIFANLALGSLAIAHSIATF